MYKYILTSAKAKRDRDHNQQYLAHPRTGFENLIWNVHCMVSTVLLWNIGLKAESSEHVPEITC